LRENPAAMIALLISFLVGGLTTLNPSALPLLPIVFGSALLGGKLGSFVLVAGLVASFTIVGLLVAPTGEFLGVNHDRLEPLIDILFAIAGIALIVPALEPKILMLFMRMGDATAATATGAKPLWIAAQFAAGILFGAIWSPSSGPALDAAIALAANAKGVEEAALRMAFFGIGAASVLLLAAFGLRGFLLWREQLVKIAPRLKQVAGALFLAPAIGMVTGIDRALETRLLDITPDWLSYLTK
jgi:cytochrome c biogenesis protein CcdA